METDLPFIDEHLAVVKAPAQVVWGALTERIIRTQLGVSEKFGRLVGVQPGGQTGTLLSARSHAVFPGPAGWAYRQMVIGSGGHRILVARLLRSVGRAAEQSTIG